MFKNSIYIALVLSFASYNVNGGCKCIDCNDKGVQTGKCTCGANEDCGYQDKPGSVCTMCEQCWFNGKCGNVDEQGNYNPGLGYFYYNSRNNRPTTPSNPSSSQISEINCENYEQVCDGEVSKNLNCSAKRTTCNCKLSEKCTCHGDSSRCFFNKNYQGRCDATGNDAYCYNGGEEGAQQLTPVIQNFSNGFLNENCKSFSFLPKWNKNNYKIDFNIIPAYCNMSFDINWQTKNQQAIMIISNEDIETFTIRPVYNGFVYNPEYIVGYRAELFNDYIQDYYQDSLKSLSVFLEFGIDNVNIYDSMGNFTLIEISSEDYLLSSQNIFIGDGVKNFKLSCCNIPDENCEQNYIQSNNFKKNKVIANNFELYNSSLIYRFNYKKKYGIILKLKSCDDNLIKITQETYGLTICVKDNCHDIKQLNQYTTYKIKISFFESHIVIFLSKSWRPFKYIYAFEDNYDHSKKYFIETGGIIIQKLSVENYNCNNLPVYARTDEDKICKKESFIEKFFKYFKNSTITSSNERYFNILFAYLFGAIFLILILGSFICVKYVKKNPNENLNSQINTEPVFTLNNNNPNSGFI